MGKHSIKKLKRRNSKNEPSSIPESKQEITNKVTPATTEVFILSTPAAPAAALSKTDFITTRYISYGFYTLLTAGISSAALFQMTPLAWIFGSTALLARGLYNFSKYREVDLNKHETINKLKEHFEEIGISPKELQAVLDKTSYSMSHAFFNWENVTDLLTHLCTIVSTQVVLLWQNKINNENGECVAEKDLRKIFLLISLATINVLLYNINNYCSEQRSAQQANLDKLKSTTAKILTTLEAVKTEYQANNNDKNSTFQFLYRSGFDPKAIDTLKESRINDIKQEHTEEVKKIITELKIKKNQSWFSKIPGLFGRTDTDNQNDLETGENNNLSKS